MCAFIKLILYLIISEPPCLQQLFVCVSNMPYFTFLSFVTHHRLTQDWLSKTVKT